MIQVEKEVLAAVLLEEGIAGACLKVVWEGVWKEVTLKHRKLWGEESAT